MVYTLCQTLSYVCYINGFLIFTTTWILYTIIIPILDLKKAESQGGYNLPKSTEPVIPFF